VRLFLDISTFHRVEEVLNSIMSAMDLAQRRRVLQERDWTKPAGATLWPAFEATVLKLVIDWDVMRAAVEGDWSDSDPYYERAKMVDDALANFADRARGGGNVTVDDLNSFFVGSMDDRFNADVEPAAVEPLAVVMSRIYDEVRQGTTTGIRHVIGDAVAQAATQHGSGFDINVGESRAPPPPAVIESGNQGGQISQDGHAEIVASSTPAPPKPSNRPVVDEDGWTTVPRRSNRVKQQYDVQTTIMGSLPAGQADAPACGVTSCGPVSCACPGDQQQSQDDDTGMTDA